MKITYTRFYPNAVLVLACLPLLISLFACAGFQRIPTDPNDICEIFYQKRSWYEDALEASFRWRIPIPVMMAIMRHESGFDPTIKPPRKTCLFILPGPRPSSAYGYPQALDTTWNDYKEYTNKSWATRDNFADAVDFIGWYCHLSHVECGISKTDAYHLFLAYHEGRGGFNRKTYRNKSWLTKTARTIRNRAASYTRQLSICEPALQNALRSRPCFF